MNCCNWRHALPLILALSLGTSSAAQKIKVIVDQDARGPGTSDQQAILVFLQSEKFDVLGITTVSGDQWVKEETQHVLRLLEIADRTDVPVIQGAEFPLLNSKEETERWEALYGKLEYKGCWTQRFEAQRSTIYEEPYHAPDVVPPMPEGEPHIEAAPGTAAQFIVPNGAQVSRRGCALGGRSSHQLRASPKVRPFRGVAGEGICLDGRRILCKQGWDQYRRY
jgi:inosine-uridine preferring nucleoside hydrolase